jgi:hypothetical protein
MIYYSGYILTELFRKMFAYDDILLRGAMGIGEFYLFEKNGDSICLEHQCLKFPIFMSLQIGLV